MVSAVLRDRVVSCFPEMGLTGSLRCPLVLATTIKQQRSDIDRKCSVSRMARPQRGTHRFTEEPAPALSIDRRATSSTPRLASCHPDRSSRRYPRVALRRI